MPYIPKTDRERLESNFQPMTEGELNYALTGIITDYVLDHGGPSYRTYNAVMGVLACMGHEIYRRLIAVYEDLKIAENGDVFPTALKYPGGMPGAQITMGDRENERG